MHYIFIWCNTSIENHRIEYWINSYNTSIHYNCMLASSVFACSGSSSDAAKALPLLTDANIDVMRLINEPQWTTCCRVNCIVLTNLMQMCVHFSFSYSLKIFSIKQIPSGCGKDCSWKQKWRVFCRRNRFSANSFATGKRNETVNIHRNVHWFCVGLLYCLLKVRSERICFCCSSSLLSWSTFSPLRIIEGTAARRRERRAKQKTSSLVHNMGSIECSILLCAQAVTLRCDRMRMNASGVPWIICHWIHFLFAAIWLIEIVSAYVGSPFHGTRSELIKFGWFRVAFAKCFRNLA